MIESSVLQVSRLQRGEDVLLRVYEQAKGELRHPHTEYGLFWPEQKVSYYYNTGRQRWSIINTVKVPPPYQRSYVKRSFQFAIFPKLLPSELQRYKVLGLVGQGAR